MHATLMSSLPSDAHVHQRGYQFLLAKIDKIDWHNRLPILHTLTKKGIGMRFANKRDTSQFGVSKIILNVNEKQYPINDSTGKYGMSQLSFGIPIPDSIITTPEASAIEGEDMIRCIEGETFQEIIKATKWGSFQTDYRMFNYLRPDFYRVIITKQNNVVI